MSQPPGGNSPTSNHVTYVTVKKMGPRVYRREGKMKHNPGAYTNHKGKRRSDVRKVKRVSHKNWHSRRRR